MIQKIIVLVMLCIFLNTSNIYGQNVGQIEIFDIEKGMVTHTVPMTPTIQKNIEEIVKEIHDVYKKFNPIPNKGQMIKIPLNPPIPVQNQWLHSLIDEIIIFLPEEGKPFIMTYDDENHTYFFISNNSMEKLLKEFNRVHSHIFDLSMLISEKRCSAYAKHLFHLL
ncbi:hypothetical protein [Cytobacillus dafuensis]|uniref:Uncharacterized protein n=1 Tax=Cytobacillus dafuensis TaxID=1742359 RepID=A0A5B8Z367_CYTDA|nr:hypothetical protein [Cytobacillus dafuensis]QED46713.1 hypothetical protein FSZ17_05170 [Cytobacillus dafuensis]